MEAVCRGSRQLVRVAEKKLCAALSSENLLDLAVYGRSPDPEGLRCGCPASAYQQGMVDCGSLDLGQGQEMAVRAD